MGLLDHCITPNWPAPAHVKALQTTRLGGVSTAPYDTLNLGLHVGDDPARVNRNRQSLAPFMPSEPVWLEQVHGTAVANADAAACRVVADACIAWQRGSVCVVMTADCLPVLLCDEAGTVVGAVHAGWKGLAAGVIEATVGAMDIAPQKLLAWLGPAIGPEAFEVGAEVRDAFVAHQPQAAEAFLPRPLGDGRGEGEKYHADIFLLARQRLYMLGIERIHGGNYCTFHQRDKFFSYRRDGVTGRMGTFIWLA
ncbi:laccase domain protein YfiH [mine drainage metagenome]|uniref:Laccase domain protein YfiH n=1 Tax=mine drainage metagenome TaxID=410659 RepID=A0A1J5T1A8_9ZZZZ